MKLEITRVVVFIGNPFEMRFLNLRINFFCGLFVLILIGFFISHYVLAKFYLWPSSTTMEGSNYWGYGYGYKTQHSYPRSRLIT